MMHPLHACLPACLRWIAERAACLPLPALVPFPSRGAEGGCEAVPPDGQTCDHRQPPAAINAHPAHPHARRGEWQLAGISVSPAGGLLCCAVLCCAVLCCADFPHCRVASDLLLSMPAEFRLPIFSLGCPCPCCSAGQRCGRLRAPAGRRADAVRGDCGWGLPSQVPGGAAQRSHAHRGVGEVSGRGWVAAGWVGEVSGALGCWGVERWVGLTSNRRLLTASTFHCSVLCFSSPHARFDTPDPQTPLPCNPRPRCACAAGRRSTGG